MVWLRMVARFTLALKLRSSCRSSRTAPAENDVDQTVTGITHSVRERPACFNLQILETRLASCGLGRHQVCSRR